MKRGDFSARVDVRATGGTVRLIAAQVNEVVDQLESVSSDIIRVSREVGTEGKLGAHAEVGGKTGTWRDLTDNINFLAGNLTNQVRNIALVTTAVANGDLSKQITVEAKGEVLELKNTINTMVEQLRCSRRRSRASPARSGPTASWAVKPRCPAWPAPGRT